MTKVIGLTGGIASGKSTVANLIRNLKLPLIDSDQVARDVMLKPEVIKELRDTFGNDIFDDEDKLSRKTLARIIYADEDKRNRLNDIVHPLVRKEIERQLSNEYQECKLVFVDVPLLYESGFDQIMDAVIVVYVPKDVQLSRLIKRDHIEEAYAHQKIKAQEDLEKKVKKADYVIDNSGSVDYTNRQLHQVLEEIEV
ncbi:MAG: dephospho-CoA kinase [Candidatus Izemoplasmataceae bacterium]